MTIHVASGTYNVSTITTGASGTPTSRIRYISDQRWGAKIISSAADIWDTNRITSGNRCV